VRLGHPRPGVRLARQPAVANVRQRQGGQPIGQIAYHDSEGRLTAFCLKRNPTRAADDELKREQFFGRLQMIHWQDEVFQYAVVGFAGFGTLEPVAAWLEDNYGEDA